MRNYKRKTENGKIPADTILRAVKIVKNEGRSINSVAKDFLIPQKTLERYVKKAKLLLNGEIKIENVGYNNGQKVFSQEHETLLTKLCKTSVGYLLRVNAERTQKICISICYF